MTDEADERRRMGRKVRERALLTLFAVGGLVFAVLIVLKLISG